MKKELEKRRGGATDENKWKWVPLFLDGLAEGLSITDAAKAAGVHVTLVYLRRRENKEFLAAWNEAAEIGTDLLEQEAQRRAFHGTVEPVFYKGVECGGIRKYSDTMLNTMLRARKPEVYRDGGDGVNRPIAINIMIKDAPEIEMTVDEVPLDLSATNPAPTTPTITYNPTDENTHNK
jgi:hypothetical protein